MSLIQLARLLPLPEEDLNQILTYASTLSKQEAAEHFNGILGESPQSIEFISSFNSRRSPPQAQTPVSTPSSSTNTSEVPKSTRGPKKKKAPLHALAARKIENTAYEAQGRAYKKDDQQDYIGAAKKAAPANTNAFSLQKQPDATQAPTSSRAPPSAAGTLISDFKNVKSKSTPNTRTSSPAPKSTKVNITGGVPMHGASTSLSALDSAIRSLEVSTNPKLQDKESRKCNCVATRHPLLAAAPNCLNCGKVICVKEGLGPCTFCNTPLLSPDQIQGMIRELKEERGKERMALDAQSHRRADISKVPAPFSNPVSGGPTPGEHGMTAAEIKAKEHRDRLLGFQAQNAKRTTVKDEASDFETPDTGVTMWGSMQERARQLKKQQKLLREQEWNAKPEYERRTQVLSIGVGGKVVRSMGKIERPKEVDEDIDTDGDELIEEERKVMEEGSGNRGAFSRNPLLGGLIKPIYKKDAEADAAATPRVKPWRRVQDDYEDNEAVILDGGVYGTESDPL